MRHIPVLAKEVIESLQLKSNMNVVDCTLGDGGHAEMILENTGPKGKLLGIDADPESIIRAKQYLYRFGERVSFVRNNFVHLKEIAQKENFFSVHGIIMDLGWSSPQFEERGRGFSFQRNEPLDMRYDMSLNKTAADILNTYEEDELQSLFKKYGEEGLNKEIAGYIAQIRTKNIISTTNDLVEIILTVYRKKLGTSREIPWVGGLHPATKVFQALRIEVNQEINILKSSLEAAISLLAPKGRLAVITFHSIEDREVKHYFKSQINKTINLVNKKPIICSETEDKENPRARSAKLRVVEKI